MKRKSVYDELIGTTVGRLKILSYANPRKFGSSNRLIPYFNVECSCGKCLEVHAGHIKNGHTTSCGCFFLENAKGETNGNYNHQLKSEDRKKFRLSQIAKWSKDVRSRDVSCIICGSRRKLVAHHLDSYANNPEKRLDINNGVTLCRECHTDFHCNFMGSYRTPCNEDDFNLYLLQV